MATFPNGIKQWTPLVDGVDYAEADQVNTIYQEVTAIETVLSDEIIYRNSADSLELSLRTSSDNVLTNNLSTEISLRLSADTLITNNLSTEISLRISADNEQSGADLSTEASLRTSGDILITNNLSTEISLRISNDNRIEALIPTDLTPILSTEIQLRISGDIVNNNNVSSENSLRLSGDAVLTNNLSTEISLMVSADSLEISLRDSAFVINSNGISTANSLRLSSDTLLNLADSLETSLRTSGDTSLSTDISTANSLRLSSDTLLSTDISTANSLRLSADTIASTGLSTEISLRISGDAAAGSSARANEETLSADKTLISTDRTFQIITFTSAKNVNLPTTGLTDGLRFVIKNNNTANYGALSVRHSGTTLGMIFAQQQIEFVYSGTNWISTTIGQAAGGTRIALGYNANCASNNSIALGNASYGDNSAISIGHSASGGSDVVAIGNSANGGGVGQSVCLGNSTNAGNQYGSVSIGVSSIANGGIAIGGYSKTNANNTAMAFGYYAQAQRWNEQAFKFDYTASTTIRYYFSRFQWQGTTSDGNALEIFLGGTSNKRATVLASSVFSFNGQFIASITNGDCKIWNISGAIKRNASNTTTLIGSITKTTVAEDAGATTWDISATADDTNESLKITVTGETAKTIIWHGVLSITELKP
jgi:hypothetical protein